MLYPHRTALNAEDDDVDSILIHRPGFSSRSWHVSAGLMVIHNERS
jgi:hypothetical protein